MKNIILLLALFLGVLQAKAGCDDEMMKGLVEETSRTLPTRMDSYTTLVSAGCYSDMLMYKYVVNDTDDQRYSKFTPEEIETFRREQTIIMSNLYCTHPDLLELHKIIRGIKYLYMLENGKMLADIVVKNSDCARPEKKGEF